MISVVIPVYNEEKNVAELHSELLEVFKNLEKPFEIIFINDGSADKTLLELKKLKPVRAISFVKNSGKSAAFDAGFRAARGNVIVTMDGDLQNIPADIPKLLAELDRGFDVAAGWRVDRWRSYFLTRRLPSLVANWLISLITGVKLHDHGCALKAYKKTALKHIELNEDMQRMVAVQAALSGAKIKEVKIGFRGRKHGISKFGANRIITVLLDLLNFYFFERYGRRVSHFFGTAGFFILILAVLTFLWAFVLKLFFATHFVNTPLPIFTAIFVVVGFQFIFMGVLAELIVRNRGKSDNSDRALYKIAEEFEV